MATKMSAKTKRVYEDILGTINYVRTHTYEEWLGKSKDAFFLRNLYEEQRSGLVHGLWDGRCLAALERRGLIRYFDDMNADDWCVKLVEE